MAGQVRLLQRIYSFADCRCAPVAVLQQTFDLSCAEVKVLQRLMDGMQVKEIAGCLLVSEATVRFHIRNLLRKTQSRSQAEMVAKVFNAMIVRVE